MNTELKKQFESEAKKEGFSIGFSQKVGRVIQYEDREGSLEFTVDLGSKGTHSIAIDPPVTHEEWQKDTSAGRRIRFALERTRRFLESCGYEVELWP